ncbi:nucleoside deaminase [Ureibacillus thermophilus]|jgi:guanine deaminase|uniref:Nucleoside deaminase n=1 Tax=Ureibacillus thermophilus TaxID=367743 RepID=A0A4P6UU46_9BACL|nr:nucleoside deaminase [Ureibacillus thermophilus]QBK26065.1 nucleoside deaminase [Ureibacillus thermophilus]
MEKKLMSQAVEMALQSAQSKNGGPFGAIIVKDGKIVGVGKNSVTTKNDPTAHAEIMAIRDACKNLNTFQLDHCEIYTSCEPCPMCLGAIYWARIEKIYYAATQHDAAQIGFDDHFIYEELAKDKSQRFIEMKQVQPEGYLKPFEYWERADEKIPY